MLPSDRTLIVGPAWIGDMVMAHSLVQRLREHNPTAEIHMLAPPATVAVASRMAEVAEVHVLDIPHGVFGLRKRFQCGRELAKVRFTQSYVLPNSWKSALVPWFARIPRRTGWLGEARRGLLNDTAALPAEHLGLMIERFMALADLAEIANPGSDAGLATVLAKPYPQPQLRSNAARQQELLARHCLEGAPEQTTDGAVALCPGAEFGQAKRWPTEHFVAVARHAISAGRQVWLMGGPADQAVCAEIAAAVDGQAINLAGKTSMEDAIDLLAVAAVVVCNDSGLMHVASAVDTPAIALFGSTSPGFTPPLHPAARALTLMELDGGANRLDCQPCFQRTCRFGHGDCLTRLLPHTVIRRLQELGVREVGVHQS